MVLIFFLKASGGGGVVENIYNTDGYLTGDRNIDKDDNRLEFDDQGDFVVHAVGNDDFNVDGDTVTVTNGLITNIN